MNTLNTNKLWLISCITFRYLNTDIQRTLYCIYGRLINKLQNMIQDYMNDKKIYVYRMYDDQWWNNLVYKMNNCYNCNVSKHYYNLKYICINQYDISNYFETIITLCFTCVDKYIDHKININFDQKLFRYIANRILY